MIHELREYRLLPENWPLYFDLFRQVCMPLRGEAFGRLRGAWLEQDSRQVRFFHLWEYESLDERARLRLALAEKPAWREEFLAQAAPQIHRQHLRVLNPQRVAEDLMAGGHDLHLVRYGCDVGRVNAVRAELEDLCDAATSIWTMEFPDPNQVLTLSASAEIEFSAEARRSLQSVEITRLKPLVI